MDNNTGPSLRDHRTNVVKTAPQGQIIAHTMVPRHTWQNKSHCRPPVGLSQLSSSDFGKGCSAFCRRAMMSGCHRPGVTARAEAVRVCPDYCRSAVQ
eukprot:scaffold24022_cov168-Amphora_coffeaeformis.AAC.17